MPSVTAPQGKPVDVARTFQQALEFHHQGRVAEAEALYSVVLAARPDHFDALQMLGVIKLGRGDLPAALRLTGAALQQRPTSPQVLLNHGNVLDAMKRHDEALANFDEAIRRKKGFAEAHGNRGAALVALERYEEALESFKRAIALKPDYADAFYNQGNALRLLNRYPEALKSFDRAIALRPKYAKAHCNRGAVLEAIGQSTEALAECERALAIQPNFPEAMLNRCGSLRALKRHDETLQALDALLAAHPNYAEAHYMRGMLLADFNRANDAVASYEKAAALKADYSKARWAACSAALPILYADEAEIGRQRAEYERRLRALCADHDAGRTPPDMTKGLGMAQPFFLAYQGRNDRELQKLFGGLASRIMAEHHGAVKLAEPPKPGEPIRVGIVCGYFFQHSVWKVGVRGWVTELDKQRFQVFCYNTSYKQDAETEIARAHAHRFDQGPRPAEEWRKIIEADRPHVIIYPEIGMNHEASELAALRLAPVQVSYIGHPQTSGYPTIDCFLSGELFEPPDGAEHYSEKLVKLPNIAFHYEPLKLDTVILNRQELGLRPSATVYWCAQSLFKYLPQYDDVFPRIAKEAGDCQFVFIRHMGHGVTELFQRRLEAAFAAHGLKSADHCVFLKSMSMSRFAATGRQCDVMLDSIGWSGGNTTLEAMAQDLPVVTFEGDLMRGRVSAGMLRMMGMPETVAGTIDDYVSLAARIARDPEWRANVKMRVIRDRERLYRDRTCIAALEQFLERAARDGTA
ncbi:MAG: tetratricopeptide repeat protein [Xanthobacteraceae bacterium]|nr:tetratricopeptide repeat protein [Xanthobacteraceae bacterium]